ncbi:MAG: hypothetical protein ABFD79_11475 [Phycisphaerales bacterium]
MARNPRQAALYEVINKSRFRDAQLKALERIGAKPKIQEPTQVPAEQKVTEVPVKQEVTQEIAKTENIITEPVKTEAVLAEPVKAEPIKTEVVAEPVKVKAETKPSKPKSVWTGRPKPVRIFPDRIELCLSWQITGLGVLALAAVFLVFFKLGQMNPITKAEPKPQSSTIRVDDIKPTVPVVRNTTPVVVETKTPKLVEPMGENAIVITSYDLQSHLEPVKAFFAQYGIATEIYKPARGSRYLLVTQNRYDNIEKSGTEGNEMKKKIMSVGANYKPPAGSGFEPFGTKPFQDVYGLKIK